MNRKQRKATHKLMVKENSARPSIMQQVPKDKWPPHQDANIMEVWLSNKFLAQVFDEGNVIRVSVCRTVLNAAGNAWQENITWDDLMEVKRQIGHAESYAVEVLPPDEHIVNVANMRHIWVLPEPVVGWFNKPVAKEAA